MPRQSLIDYLLQYAGPGADTAFVQRSGYRTERWSYTEVARLAERCAREYEAKGVSPGDRVILWGGNSPEWVAAFRGCVLRGAVAVPMDRGSTPDFVGRVAQQVDARLVILPQEKARDGA